ncbi:hypothetical protein AM10699_00050 [Acaryochloris marina MBIC10699]|nr:hypothetical protein AM10699_00050 [Acaryochloris marina MBIC10699]
MGTAAKVGLVATWGEFAGDDRLDAAGVQAKESRKDKHIKPKNDRNRWENFFFPHNQIF